MTADFLRSPTPDPVELADLDLGGLNIAAEALADLLDPKMEDRKAELAGLEAQLTRFGNRLPARIKAQFDRLAKALGK